MRSLKKEMAGRHSSGKRFGGGTGDTCEDEDEDEDSSIFCIGSSAMISCYFHLDFKNRVT